MCSYICRYYNCIANCHQSSRVALDFPSIFVNSKVINSSSHIHCVHVHQYFPDHISRQANVNARGGSQQRTPLHYASLSNNVAIATILLAAGANEFSRDATGLTALNLSMGGEMCRLLHKVALIIHAYLQLFFGSRM